MPKVKDAEAKENKRRNGKLSLYPLKFGGAVKDLLRVKPEQPSQGQVNLRK